MALLHGAKREATFKAAMPNTVLWSLSRDAYRSTVKEAVEKRRSAHKDFLRGVAAFEQLTDYDILTLADAVVEEEFGPGEVICRQGEPSGDLSIVSCPITAKFGRRVGLSVHALLK